MDGVIKQLKTNNDSAVKKLSQIHGYLSSLMYYSRGAYYCTIDNLYNDYFFKELCAGMWGSNVLRDITMHALKTFENSWSEYRKEKPYGDDGTFVYFDPEWQTILKSQLIPLLDEMELDFARQKIEFKSYLEEQELAALPDVDDILERGQKLYELLIKHNVIRRAIIGGR